MLGELALEAGDVNAATERFARSLEVCHEAEDKRGETTALWWQARRISPEKECDGLGASLRRAPAFQAFEMYAEMLGCLEDVADLLHVRGMPDDAACLYAAVERLRERLALSQRPRAEVRRKDRVATLRRALGDAAFDAAWAEGRTWGIEKTIRCWRCLRRHRKPLRLEPLTSDAGSHEG